MWLKIYTGYSGTLMQQHYYQNGSTYFVLPWVNYANGFGSPNGNYWIGNDKLRNLTSTGNYKLRIDVLSSINCTWYYAIYGLIIVGPATAMYKLTVNQYSGNLGDVLTFSDDAGAAGWGSSNGMKFTTIDQDNDLDNGYYGNCAQCSNANTCGCPGGAFWHNTCSGAFVNGPDKCFQILAKIPGWSIYKYIPLVYSRFTLI